MLTVGSSELEDINLFGTFLFEVSKAQTVQNRITQTDINLGFPLKGNEIVAV